MPCLVRTQPPEGFTRSAASTSPEPDLVSTVLNEGWSNPARLARSSLQATLQWWQPMHLSRLITIASCAITLIGGTPRGAVGGVEREARSGG
ncbi:hypothetical protein GCM10009617_02770 [Leifsonia poae]|uniref:Uncharacterized protein n=1 Tax=Leifsonia poae TaxID=110933 RepID=A0A9W6H6A7_9MICO|nr:hypothetical protein GCM10017584_02770 [Leifsonia poae]